MSLHFEQESSSSFFSSSSSYASNELPSNVSPISPKRKTGRKKFQETRHPIYRGVRKRHGEKWVCEVRVPNSNTRIWLGTYATPEMAARAYDVAALAFKGNSAPVNFPDSAWLLRRSKSLLATDIQSAAVEAAESFRPTTSKLCLKSPVFEERPEKVLETCCRLFMDEEEMFNMPLLLANMAEGLLLAPSSVPKRFNWDDEFTCTMDLSLWG